MENEKKVVNEKHYTIKITDYDDNTVEITYDNKGLNTFEILGLIKYVESKINSELIK